MGDGLNNGGNKTEQRTCLDFKIIMDDFKNGQQIVAHLVAPTRQEKAAWITDISQVRRIVSVPPPSEQRCTT